MKLVSKIYHVSGMLFAINCKIVILPTILREEINMSFYTSLTGINAAVNRLEVSSNNIANAQTDTFKKSRVNFQDIYTFNPTQLRGASIGQGSNVATVNQNFSQGSLTSTINTLDLAISGDGLYVMQDKNNKDFYSRAGQFQLSDDGLLVNSEGDRVMGVKGVAVPNNGIYQLEGVKINNKTVGQSRPTTQIDIGINLPADDEIIKVPFDPKDDKSYNRKNIIKIYDSSGNPRDATIFYVKKSNPTESKQFIEWDTHFYIDGKRQDPPVKNPVVNENDKFIEWKGDGISSEQFQWDSSAFPNVADGAISIIDGKVYQGNGSAAKLIGMIDPVNNGKNGQPLRINYIDPVKPINQLLQNGVAMNMDSGLKPIGFIPAGSSNIKIDVDGFFGAEDDIQLFDANGKHILGTPINEPDADATWKTNGVSNTYDANLVLIKDEYGFEYGSVFDGAPPLVRKLDNQPHVSDANLGVVANVNGMKISYTGDGDRSLDDLDFNNGSTNQSIEKVIIDKATEPLFLMVSGNGVFNVMVSWDSMPDIASPKINFNGLKDKISFVGAESSIQFPINGSKIISGNPKTYPSINIGEGISFPEIVVRHDSTTGFGGAYKSGDIRQNGKPEGDLSSIDINKDGVVSAFYNNGNIEKVATLILAKFNNPQGLIQLGDTKYFKSTSSGPEMANKPGYGGLGSLVSGAIEQSNVDITTELVDLIEAQRNFQSNSKAMETTDKMTKTMIDNIS